MDLITQLKRDERLRLKPYNDTVGKLTIGYGRDLEDDGISPAEADVMLEDDIAIVRADLDKYLPWARQLDDARYGVLMNMAFNMGIGDATKGTGLMGFKHTLAMVQTGDYNGAAAAMLQSKWAGQVGARATRLATQMRTGEWQ
jgi:lysozyme